ncbi:hypothetical protein Hanom_Chr13g01233371 [Helianthus anomalus]
MGRNEEDQNMVDEVEDGEIRSPEVTPPPPEKILDDERSLHGDPQEFSAHEKSPCFDFLDNEGPLHDNVGESHGNFSKPRESHLNNDLEHSMAAEKLNGGPILYEEREGIFNNEQFGPNNTPGLSKKTQLGKRDRNVRSPPSVGSVQVNCTRPRQDSGDALDESIDLNRSGAHQEPSSPENCSVNPHLFSPANRNMPGTSESEVNRIQEEN